jgi:hypothetical protein
MQKKLLLFIVLIIIFASLPDCLLAQDTIVVQTLSFDSITGRRGTYKFPDNPGQFRKILMLNTLKCDPRTTQDKYNCGEWDYLTYHVVYKHTGKFDSTQGEAPYFKLGWEAPDSIQYTSKPTISSFQKKYYSRKINSSSNEETFNIGADSSELNTGSPFYRTQFVISSKDLKAFGFTKGNMDRIKIFAKDAGGTLKNFTIKIRNAPAGNLLSFVNSSFTTVYQVETRNLNSGWNDFDLMKSFNWTGMSNLIIDISFELKSGTAPILMGRPSTKAFITNATDSYLQFDGINDFVECGKMSELANAQKFTLEGWIRVDQWENWNRVFGTNSTHIELGDKVGQIYCIVRNANNTHANALSAISLNEWTHIAFVYDGNQVKNSDRIKLYINGELRGLTYTDNIPANTIGTIESFNLTDVSNSNASMKGALNEIRVWNEALDAATITNWFDQKINSSHPNYNNLVANYDMDLDKSTTLRDESKTGKYPAKLFGCPQWESMLPENVSMNATETANVPTLQFLRGNYNSQVDSIIINYDITNPPISIITYKVQGNGVVPDNVQYVWKSGYTYKYDTEGKIIDSTLITTENKLKNYKLKFYNPPFELTDQYEIGRFITPYGINLDLGPTGFTWAYDVTDYAPLLQGNVDLSAGNQQELIDLKFLFIKGTTPRDVLRIDRIWGGFASYSYKDLSDDKVLSAINIPLLVNAKQFKVKTRLTGHGHQSNDGNYPHCCEWKDNTHSFLVNDNTVSTWHIFLNDECALNPVYPQGGTWPGSREGWCPGDLVRDHEIEITKNITGSSVKLDYDITKVPANNLGMGSGNYVVAMDLIEYSDLKFNKDIEINQVITPNKEPYYSRKNPICSNPMVEIRNNGKETVNSIRFKYKVSGGQEFVYNWNGELQSLEKSTISLPIPGSSFWIGDANKKFELEAWLEDSKMDDNPETNKFWTFFNLPDLYPETIILNYQTNRRPADYTYQVLDINDKVVFSKTDLLSETNYLDTLNLPKGCYTLQLLDANNMGLSYWAYTEQGSGFIRILDPKSKPLKAFNPDFGKGISYSFNLGDITFIPEQDFEYFVSIFPNPTEKDVTIKINFELGLSRFQVFDLNGTEILSERINSTLDYSYNINSSSLSAGAYFVRISNGQYDITRKFIKK